MATKPPSPVLVIAYRRPDKISKVLEAIESQGPRRVYLFCDGPASMADEHAQSEIAHLASSLGHEFKLATRFEPEHLGLKRAVTAALDWFFSVESLGIILEDDVVPTSEFFLFCDDALEHYRGVKEIQQISGSNIFGNLLKFSVRHFLSARMEVWGWATWADRWHEFRSSEQLPETLSLTPCLPNGLAKELEHGHRRAESGELDTWDYSWAWYAMTRQRLCLISKVNLTKNIGFDDSATHTRSGKPFTIGHLKGRTKYPAVVNADRLFDHAAHLIRRSKLVRFRVEKKIKRIQRWLRHVVRRPLSLNLL